MDQTLPRLCLIKPRQCRTRSGCLTCRRRRKKCDEKKPRCCNCDRNGLSCTWPSPLRFRVYGATRDGVFQEYRASRTTSPSVAGVDDEVSQGTDSPAGEHWRPEKTSSSSPDTAVGIPHSTAKAAHIYHSPRMRYPSLSRPLSPFPTMNMAASELPHFYPLLQHYCEITAPLLSMSPSQENPFLSEVLPLTLTSDIVMYAILAMAGLHAGYRNREFQCAAKLYYGKLISMLKRGIDCATSEDSPTYLTVLLLLCYSEVSMSHPNGYCLSTNLIPVSLWMATLTAHSSATFERPGC